MIVISSAKDLKEYLRDKNSVGFVPTMGAIHEGHVSLMKRSVAECETTVVSIFVNPTQFLAGEDLSTYPRTFESDKQACKSSGVDVIFFPQIAEIYKKDELKVIAPKKRGYILEGERRVGHFDGVLTVVLKLLNIVSPNRAYFGKKDAQQLILIHQMVKDLFLDVEIVFCELIREKSGLALSSRNVYLNAQEKQRALLISQSLFNAEKMIAKGCVSVEEILQQILENLEPIDVEYVEIRNRELELIKTVELNNSIVLVAAKVGTTRLIDNIWV